MSREFLHRKETLKFSEHLKKLRQIKVLTQNQLAETSGISQSRISLMENRKGELNPVFRTLVQLSSAYKIEMISLFDYSLVGLKRLKRKFPSIEHRFKIETKMFAERINKLLDCRMLKQEELAILSQIDPSEISRLLKGGENTELHNIIDISIALEVEVKCLFDYKGPLPQNRFLGKLIT